MKLDGAAVVVTGAGSGIGAALVERFVAEGAQVLACDLDGTGLRAGSAAHHVVADLREEEANRALVREAISRLGGVDLFCANAGVGTHGGVRGPDAATAADWQRTWEINVMAHVWAAGELVEHWADRGGGRFLATVSAAGILTMLGSAPYSVTKHGALAFAEWLRATYAHRGIVVQALCPQGVRTPLLEASGPVGAALLEGSAIEVSDVVDAVIAALETDRFLVLPHPEVAEYARRKAVDPDRWLAAMNSAQQQIESSPGSQERWARR